MLLSNGADCNATDEEGRDVLSYACEEKCNDLVTILVRYNINPEIEDNKGKAHNSDVFEVLPCIASSMHQLCLSGAKRR